jgi:hypothetical protein
MLTDDSQADPSESGIDSKRHCPKECSHAAMTAAVGAGIL